MKDNRMRGLLLALVATLLLAAPAVATAQTAPEGGGEAETPETGTPETGTPAPETTQAPDRKLIKKLRKQIRKAQKKTRHWDRVMGRRLTKAKYNGRQTTSIVRLRQIRADWRQRARAARKKARKVPNQSAWLCIKRHEGAWRDPHPPYWGGLQMDMSFQRTYGRYLLKKKGTANRWKPVEQMWTAEKARRSGRGFHPWPNTARYCGLL